MPVKITSLACLGLALLLAIGCQNKNITDSNRSAYPCSKPARGIVVGFGEGKTKTHAGQEAWDDAFDRINAMGIKRFRVTGYQMTRNQQSQGRWYRDIQVRFEPLETTCPTAAPHPTSAPADSPDMP